MDSFGANLRVVRERLGLSQADLAERAGLHRNAVSNAERGASVSLKNALAIADALGVGLTTLVDGYDVLEPHALRNLLRERLEGLPDGRLVLTLRLLDVLAVDPPNR